MMNYIHSAPIRYRLILGFVALLVFLPTFLFATHNRAGEITYEKLGTYTYRATIVTYTKTSSPADRPELEFWWGDGTRDTVPRSNIVFGVGPDIQKNTYVATHVYPGPGTFTMYFLDENRNANVVNIPGSVNIPFYVETQLIISPAFLTNSSPQLLQPPIDNGAVNRLFIHNPNAFDPDGDSLSYELTECKGFGGQPVPGYVFPSASVSFTLDPVTGDLVWDAPQLVGEYNVAMIIREWRSIPGVGLLNIGFVTRDMQITIYPPVNDPPVIAALVDTCVLAGTLLSFTVSATDNNASETVSLTATGGPFAIVQSPASFISTPSQGTATGDFSWNTVCAHVRRSPYAVVFKAEDNNAQVPLVDLESVSITVVGPAPQNPQAVPSGNSLQLSWDQSACTEAVGYYVYRRVSVYGFNPGNCETGVPAYTGYVRIATLNGLSATSFVDNDNGSGLAPAVEYCYMVTAFYPDGAESYASIEFCGRLIRDLPVLTNADVDLTDAVNGVVQIAWSKPTQLDPIQTPGPYRYVLQRETAPGSFTDVVSYNDLNDTLHTESGLNTQNVRHRYRVQLWNDTPGNTFLSGSTRPATTVFLTINPGDRKNRLQWDFDVPWANTYYRIFRNAGSGSFQLVDSTASLSYTDDSLVNGNTYCYYIESVGAYQDTGLVNPILNRSQQACGTPIDNEPPCAPVISGNSDCEALRIELTWSVIDSCGADAGVFEIYFTPSGTGLPVLLATVYSPDSSYTYTATNSISGCYAILAVDTNGNRGELGAPICEGPCPEYELPNIFTPDNNQVNDLFHPILPYRDVVRVDMRIFNRWGDQVFKTEDPFIGWNGTRNNEGVDCPEGVYFYICEVFETPDPLLNAQQTPRVLNGFIHLTRTTSP